MKKIKFILIQFAIYSILFIGCNKDNEIQSIVDPVTPAFGDFSPKTAFIGDTITISGKNLGTDSNMLIVKFGMIEAKIESVSETSAKVIVPDDIEEANTKIEIISKTTKVTLSKDFKLKAPVVEFISPTSGPAGQQVIITGKGFRKSDKMKQILFGDKIIDAVNPSHDKLTLYVPDGTPVGKYSIYVTVAGQKILAGEFNVIVPLVPVITSFSPESAFIGETITISGKDLGTNPDALSIKFGAVDARVISVSGTSAQVVVPDDIEEKSVKIRLLVPSGTEISIPNNLKIKAPIIESISPIIGFSGEQIKIVGKGFRKSYHFDQITFGNTIVKSNVTTPGNSELRFRIPKNLPTGKYPVFVTVLGKTITVPSTVEVIVPTITSFTPDSGNKYATVTIKGTHFVDVNNGTSPSVTLSDFKTDLNTRGVYVTSFNENEIKISLGGNVIAGTYKITVMIVGSSVSTTSTFTVKE